MAHPPPAPATSRSSASSSRHGAPLAAAACPFLVAPAKLETRELRPAIAVRELHPPWPRSSSARHGRAGARGGEASARHGHARSSRRYHVATRASSSLLLQSPPSLHSSRRAHCQWRLSPTPLRCAHQEQKMGRGGEIRVPQCPLYEIRGVTTAARRLARKPAAAAAGNARRGRVGMEREMRRRGRRR